MKHKIFKNSLDGRFNPKTVILSKIRVKTMEKTLTQLKVNINMTGLTLIVRGFWKLLECGGGQMCLHLLDHQETL